jgi:hypothetical protein
VLHACRQPIVLVRRGVLLAPGAECVDLDIVGDFDASIERREFHVVLRVAENVVEIRVAIREGHVGVRIRSQEISAYDTRIDGAAVGVSVTPAFASEVHIRAV